MESLNHVVVLPVLLVSLLPGYAQDKPGGTRDQRMEITLQRLDGGVWRSVDPGVICRQNDRVRFSFRSNFNGYLYVVNHSTSGSYEQLFPGEATGRNNRIVAGDEYKVPNTDTAFRIAGPPGYEVIYWLVSPVELAISPAPDSSASPRRSSPPKGNSPNLLPRCDDNLFRARGECIDASAGPKMVGADEKLPEHLSSGRANARELLVIREKDKSVIASPAPLAGPAVYEFRLAHK